eukprot:COSAG02_NODE_439_length_22308_cov_18.013508_8_plen_321_part_00
MDLEEFTAGCTTLGIEISPAEAAKEFAICDTDGSNTVRFEEFATWCCHQSEGTDPLARESAEDLQRDRCAQKVKAYLLQQGNYSDGVVKAFKKARYEPMSWVDELEQLEREGLLATFVRSCEMKERREANAGGKDKATGVAAGKAPEPGALPDPAPEPQPEACQQVHEGIPPSAPPQDPESSLARTQSDRTAARFNDLDSLSAKLDSIEADLDGCGDAPFAGKKKVLLTLQMQLQQLDAALDEMGLSGLTGESSLRSRKRMLLDKCGSLQTASEAKLLEVKDAEQETAVDRNVEARTPVTELKLENRVQAFMFGSGSESE